MKRFRLSKRRDRKIFRRTSGHHKGNVPTAKFVMRGGIRK